MYCPECGAQLTNSPKFCSTCGHAITGSAALARQVTVNPPPQTPVHAGVATPSLGTKWLKFWNYFSLPVGGVLGLLMSLGLPALAIIMVPISILQFVVAFGLHHRRLWAWQWNWVLIVITYISMAIPTPTPGAHSGGAELVFEFVIKVVLGGLIWMWPNHVYWKKRRALFA
jgi:predicted amidophosphoribosyltransferase